MAIVRLADRPPVWLSDMLDGLHNMATECARNGYLCSARRLDLTAGTLRREHQFTVAALAKAPGHE